MIETTRAIGVDTRNELPTGWRWVRLGEVCELNPRRPAIVRADDAPTTFVPMAAVGEGGSGVVQAGTRPYKEVKRGYTYVGEEDVLFAKITPCMQNGKHAIAHHLIDGMGFGSTEFHVIRPTEAVLPDWIQRFLMQPVILSAATTHFTGAVGQQRVPAAFLAHLAIPLPPLPEQRRIAAILRERMAAVERARAAAEAQLAAARALPAAYLRAVFESEVVRDADTPRLGDICRIVAPQVDPRLLQYGALPHVNGENIESGTGRLLYVHTAAEEGMISGKYLFDEGDVLYSKLRPYLRKVVVAEFRGVCSADMYPIKVDRHTLNPHFLAWTLLSDEFTSYAEEESRRARMPKLNREQLLSWEMAVPSLADQSRLAAMLDAQMAGADRARQALEGQLDAINHLPAALLRQAFSGEL